MSQTDPIYDLPCTAMNSEEMQSNEVTAAGQPTSLSDLSTSPEGNSLLRSNAIVALGTGLSRLTGMLKVIVFGVIIGQTALADAYDGANNSPNAVYELLLGGV